MPATIVGRCQRFDFRRLTMDDLSTHLIKVAEAEGVNLEPSAANAIARQAEGSARDALSLLDQASVMGGESIDDDVVRALLGAPRSEVQHEVADAVAVGDARGCFETVNRLVAGGQDLRQVTAELLAHFRNLLIVKAAPGQEDLLDIQSDAYETLRIQADKFTPGELARVIALLLACQNDMRWTTSPRLSLELALVRATIPDTDPNPAGTISRLERLERLANLEPGSTVPPESAAPKAAPGPADDNTPVEPIPAPAAVKAPEPPAEAAPEPSPEPSPTVIPTHPAEGQGPLVPHAADAGAVDVTMLRRSWPSLIEHLGAQRQMILKAVLESATVAQFDGETLELAFPPDRKVGPQKVEERQEELRAALGDLFGIRPTITCVVRELREPGGGPATLDLVEEEEVPDQAEALRRVQEMLGAQPAESE
jgi:DNA polymerase-3 subunit gamma/tau